MALASQIAAADNKDRAPVGDRFDSVHLVHVAVGKPDEEERELIRATRAVLRIAADMGLDDNACREVLDALGLPAAIARSRP